MQVFEALEIVNKQYVNGAFKFFATITPDPWMDAHEKFEAELLVHGIGTPKASEACEEFVKTCTILLDAYKKINPEKHKSNIQDAFFHGERYAEKASVEERKCFSCESTEGLKITRKNDKAMLLCANCLKAK